MSVCMSACQSVCLSIYPFVRPPVCLFTYMNISSTSDAHQTCAVTIATIIIRSSSSSSSNTAAWDVRSWCKTEVGTKSRNGNRVGSKVRVHQLISQVIVWWFVSATLCHDENNYRLQKVTSLTCHTRGRLIELHCSLSRKELPFPSCSISLGTDIPWLCLWRVIWLLPLVMSKFLKRYSIGKCRASAYWRALLEKPSSIGDEFFACDLN